MNIRDFPSLSEAKSFVCTTVKSALEADIEKRGEASLILTGGSSVRPFLDALTNLDIPWDKVWVALSDERWVPITHDMSNEKQLRVLFLNHLKVSPRYISLKEGHGSAVEAALYLKNMICKIPQPFTCALLSMGSDGHVASLFPEEVNDWKKKGIGIFFTKKQLIPRISLNEEALLASKNIYIIATGTEKIKFLKTLDTSSYPLGRVYEKSEIIRSS